MGKVHVIRGETGGKSYNQGVKSLKIDQYSVTSNYLSITGKIPYLFPPPLEVGGGVECGQNVYHWVYVVKNRLYIRLDLGQPLLSAY